MLVENMDLIGGYLLVLLMLFAANMSLLMGNFKLNNSKLVGISIIFFLVSTVLMFISNTFLSSLSFLIVNLGYLFLVLSIAIFIIIIYYSRDSSKNLKNSIIILILLAAISVILLSSTAKLSLFGMLTYSLLGFLVIFSVYKLSKLLVHAKREYPIIIREFMCLFAILMLIFALTYNSTLNLNYKMFGSFLILTPTYQIIYVFIAIVVGIVIGFVWDDNMGGNS